MFKDLKNLNILNDILKNSKMLKRIFIGIAIILGIVLVSSILTHWVFFLIVGGLGGIYYLYSKYLKKE